MAEIIPAILETSFTEVTRKLALVKGIVPLAQIDICDGIFTDAPTWPYITPPRAGKPFNYEKSLQFMIAQKEEMPFWNEIEVELDLMVADPIRMLPDLLNAGPKRVIIHMASLKDAVNDLHDIARIVPGLVEIGIACLPDADMEKVSVLVDERLISFVQCMGIAKVGVQGTPTDPVVLEKTCSNLRFLRARYPTMPLSVDGGVTRETAKQLTEAGATRLVCGSAVFGGENPQKRIAELRAVI